MRSAILPLPLSALIPIHSYVPGGRKKWFGFVKSCFLFFALFLSAFQTNDIFAQTDFAPGEIMFTGYRSDDPDRFSIVILKDVVAGTTIYITDRGWDNSVGDGFRDDQTGEGTISFTFSSNHLCGSEFFFNDVGGTNDWQAADLNNNLVGTVTILTSTTESPFQDVDGPELTNMGFGTDGDQLFIYQLPEPSPSNQGSFVTGIHMNSNWNNNNDSESTSEKPTALSNSDVVRFGEVWDNVKYDCDPYIGVPSFLKSVITNDNGSGGIVPYESNNWTESNDAFGIAGPCFFCCGNSTPPIPFISTSSPIMTNQMFAIYVDGVLSPGESWQLFLGGCGIGSPIMTTTADSFLLTAPSTSQTITYYVRSSEDSGCECGVLQVCFVANFNTTCSLCSADPLICGDCYLPDPIPNPPLTSGCHEQKLIFILDESGSVGPFTTQVEEAVITFLEALNGQEIEAAIIEFSNLGTLVTDYTVIDDSFIANMQSYLGAGWNGNNYSPNGGTNWHDAMVEADALDTAGLILFFTDGEPTGWSSAGFMDCGDGATTQTPEIVNPVKIANKLKGEGTHIFMLGVGSGIDETNLQAMSGPIEYQSGVNSLGTADYSIGNFNTLADELEEFVFELCETTYTFEKTVSGDPCSGMLSFTFTITNTGTQSATPYFIVQDTFPNGYTNIMYNGPEPKLCVGDECFPALPPNAFYWGVYPIAPGESTSATLTAELLPEGNYQNIAWAVVSNGEVLSDTVSIDSIMTDPDPIIDCPDNVTISCAASTLPPATGTATAIDPGSSTPVVTYTDNIVGGNCPSAYIINRTWKATDTCMNVATCVQIITIQDVIAPILNCPPDISFQCHQAFTLEQTGTATASDNCDPSLAVTFSDVTMSGGCVQTYTINRTWLATDDCGNQATCLQKISIVDSTPPVMTCPSNITIACSASTLPPNTGLAQGIDACDMVSDVSYQDVLMGCPENFTILRTWTVSDDCGNSLTCQQVITIQDLQAPQVTCPANVTIQCGEDTSPSFTGQATTSDNCDANPTLIHNDVITPGNCSSSYSITRTWTASDDGCNITMCTQIITIVDNMSPVLVCPPDITMACNTSTLPSVTGSATATDNCDISVSPVYSDIITNSGCSQAFIITRTWTSTDECGNSATCQQLITYADHTAPVLTCAPDITIDCNSLTLPSVTGQSTATDVCDASVTPLYSDLVIDGNCEQAYTINRTWTSTDDCGNSTTCMQVINVVDILPPSIICPPNITIVCNENTLPANTGEPIVIDNCDAAPLFSYNDVTTAGPSPNGYTIDRTWTTIDACGNTSVCLQTIRVDNPLDPSITEFTYDTICAGSSVAFSTTSQGISPVTYTWSFGEGSSPAGATGLGPHTVTYNSSGNNGTIGAHVLLTVSAAGCASVTDTVGNVIVNPIPNPAIDATTAPICYFRLKTFKPLAPMMPGFAYQWNFGAGASIPSINGYGPHQVKYSTTGTKTVQLIVSSNAQGVSCNDTATISFNVLSCPGNITGKVRREDGTPIQGVNVRLFPDANRDGMSDGGVPVRNVNTNSLGIYSMATLTPGQYVIVETQPPDYFSFLDVDESDDNDSTVLVNHPNDNIIPATIEPQEIDSNNIFVDVPNPGLINGYVFQDMDNDDAPDTGEGIQNVTIRLFADNDANGVADSSIPLDSTTTSNTGWYSFGNIVNGHYVVTETQPSGFLTVKDFDPSVDDDAVLNTNMTDDIIPVTITNGENDADNHFKESPSCTHLVTNLNNDGPGSLRYVIECASSGDTISFHNNLAGEIIYLLQRIEINKNLFIHSDVLPRVKIESQAAGAFKVLPAITVEFRNLDFTSGTSGTPGAAFENYGHLILWDVSVFKNLLLPPNDYLFFNDASAIISAKGVIKLESD